MNAYGRSAQEQRAFESLRYPETLNPERTHGVLINKFRLRDPQILELAERGAVQRRLQDGLPAEAKSLSVSGVKAIHHHILQDVYEWAGAFRRYTTGRGSAPFAPPDFIESSLSGLIDKLKGEGFLHGLDDKAMASRSAHYVNELNAIHPFVDGNGRMQRTWLRNLCEQAGYHLAFREGDRDAWNAASAHGFHKSDDKMTAFLSERLRPIGQRHRETQAISDPSHDRLHALRQRYSNADKADPNGDKQGGGQKQ